MEVALTFDDGPGPSTGALLDVLDAAGARATFFLIGRNLERAPWGQPAAARALAVRMARAGHLLGNHSFEHRHPSLGVDAAVLAGEIARVDALIEGVYDEAGVARRPIPFRLPYGPVGDDPRLAITGGLGRPHVHWSQWFEDWTEGELPDLAARMIAHVAELGAAGRSAVLDLHDSGTGSPTGGYTRAATVAGVAEFLAEAGRRGWRLFQAPR